MRILVVCGAGASSTFVAMRVRKAASAAGMDVTTSACSQSALPEEINGADVVLVGPHLSASIDTIRREAVRPGAQVILLPPDVYSDMDGTRTLDLIHAALAPADPSPVFDSNSRRNDS